MIRYHGVFAPNFKGRKLIVPKTPMESQIHGTVDQPEKAKRERLRWSEMLKRTFEIDVTVCPKCSGRLEQIAVIKDRVVAKAILESFSEVTVFHPIQELKDRGPPAGKADFHDLDQREAWW